MKNRLINQDHLIKSVMKSLDIMELFSTDTPRLSLGEIADRLRLPKSTTHNLLSTLLWRGYIEQLDEGRYALGKAVIPLTQAVRVNVELRDRAAPLLRELADVSRESVYLTVLEGAYLLYIYAIESPRRLLARSAVGDRVPPHCTAVGKAILSELAWEQVVEIAEHTALPRFTENTLTDIEALGGDLEETRARGYAIDHEEHELGVCCVGAVIRDACGQPIASCSVSGPTEAFSEARIKEWAMRIVDVAQETSRRMGYVPKRSPAVLLAMPGTRFERGSS